MKPVSSLAAERELHLKIARSILPAELHGAIRTYRSKSNVTIRPTRAFPKIALEIRHSEAKGPVEPPSGPFVLIRHAIGKRKMYSSVGRYGIKLSGTIAMENFDEHARAVSAVIKAMLKHTKGPQWKR